jgi:hypothetical protein
VAITFVAWNETATADAIREHLGLRDEPVYEVYSTSQLLVDLFDLPTVEEAAASRVAARAEQAAAGDAHADETGTPSKHRSGSRRRRRRRLAGPRETPSASPAVAS